MSCQNPSPKDATWKTEFFARIISRKQRANQGKQLRHNAFHVKNYRYLDPAKKLKSAHKAIQYMHFLHEIL